MSPKTTKGAIRLVKATTHNLKGVSLSLQHGDLIVVTGLSGSGKSSLAFHTLFIESLRCYTESFSPYVRQFIGKIPRPPVEALHGILPSIGMRQKAAGYNPAARVSTTAELYPYFRLLYARIGKIYSPISGQEVKKDSISDVQAYVQGQQEESKATILAALKCTTTLEECLTTTLAQGFSRVLYKEQLYSIEELLATMPPVLAAEEHPKLFLVVDRVVVRKDDTMLGERLADSVQRAFFEGGGSCRVHIEGQQERTFSDRFACDGIHFAEPSEDFFNFHSPHGACQKCGGRGKFMGIDYHKVVPNPALTLSQGAIAPWNSPAMNMWLTRLLEGYAGFPTKTPYQELSQEEQAYLWHGNGKSSFRGIEGFFAFLESDAQKLPYHTLLSNYRSYTACHACRGTGLREDVHYVKISGKSLIDLLCMSVKEAVDFFATLTLTPRDQQIGKVVLEEIGTRLQYLTYVGLHYLTFQRATHTLSGGEYQRIRLARALGSGLVDTLYILDEPTIGLHPRDTQRLIEVLLALKRAGNTLVIVEHEEALMRVADQIVDIGPRAGSQGGKVVFQGTQQQLLHAKGSLTADYLTGKSTIEIPAYHNRPERLLTLSGSSRNNVRDITLSLPLGLFTTITGVSGSGKSTIVGILHDAVAAYLSLGTTEGTFGKLGGPFQDIEHIELIGQNPLGRTTRSNPATYLKAYDAIRKLFASLPKAEARSYTPSFFSFNVDGGRCDACFGEGTTKVEMQFMEDITMPCDACRGKRFKQEALEITWEGKNIYEVLSMTVEESIAFFATKKSIVRRLLPLQEIGLGYLTLGQSCSTLSGGEAQRVKLATYLQQGSEARPTIFIFDEPTTGLHFHDISKLLKVFYKLVAHGHTVVAVEHNLDVIKCADWIMDLGPDGGDKGGKIIFQGTPEEMVHDGEGYTAAYLRKKLQK